MLLVTMLAANTWDGVSRGSQLLPGKVLMDALALMVLTIGMISTGRGRAWAMLVPAAYVALQLITALREMDRLPPAARTGVNAFFGFVVLLCVIAAVTYSRLTIDPR
jgi:hypothetical protein